MDLNCADLRRVSVWGFESPRHRDLRPWVFCCFPFPVTTIVAEPSLLARFRELQSYVGWTEDDARRVSHARPLLTPHLSDLIEDFYAEIERHPEARKVITGGEVQIHRLKGTLLGWITELLSGVYDEDYVTRRWRVGLKHVEIGLDQVYTNVALSRLRTGLSVRLETAWSGSCQELTQTMQSLDKLLDLDLAIIEDAYQYEYMSKLQRTERLATLGQVAGGIAHELRNPLNVVKTSVYYLLNARNPPQAKQLEHLGRIERNVESADAVISALSNFARMRTPSLSAVKLEPLIRRVLEDNPLSPSITAVVDCPAELLDAACDGEQLGIVLGNLVRNARDAMSEGGRLDIRARAGAGFVEIEVADEGVGIDPEILPHIMEPLYSTKARGLGLGLSIARSIIERNGGSIRAESVLGRGSVFTVRLVVASLEGGL